MPSGQWETIRMQDIKEGDIFRMSHPNEPDLIHTHYIAEQDAIFGSEMYPDVWGVMSTVTRKTISVEDLPEEDFQSIMDAEVPPEHK